MSRRRTRQRVAPASPQGRSRFYRRRRRPSPCSIRTLAVLGAGWAPVSTASYDEPDDKDHSHESQPPIGTSAIDQRRATPSPPSTETQSRRRCGRRQGHIFVNNEARTPSSDRRQDVESDRIVPLAPCEADGHRMTRRRTAFLRVQQNLRRRREHGQNRGVHHERRVDALDGNRRRN